MANLIQLSDIKINKNVKNIVNPFIPDLNESRESEFFRSTGSISHVLGPRKLSDSEPE